MKNVIKMFVCEIVYLAYRSKLLKNKLRVMSIDETIDSMINTNKSLVRFGDGEINIIEGKTAKFQQFDKVLADRLSDILRYRDDRIMVGIPDIFESLDGYTKKSARFWKEHLFFSRKTYIKYCDAEKLYANAFFSRPYYICKDKTKSGRWFHKMKEIWENKDIVIVEGETTYMGVGNDLLDNTASICRILCPAQNAYLAYDQIREACMEVEQDKLFLLSVGPTAKLLVTDLVDAGCRVIDIGNIDLEYEWYLQKTIEKTDIPKHSVVGEEANLREGAQYTEYWKQVKKIIKIEQ